MTTQPTAAPGPSAAEFKTMSPEEALRLLSSDPQRGLDSGSVRERLLRYGPNAVAEEPRNPWLDFLGKFWGLTAGMLELTAALSLIRRRYLDAGIIACLLLVNGVISFLQETRAHRAVEDLKKRLTIRSRTLRDGVWGEVPSESLVPGDILRLRLGDFIPADAKLLSGDLQLDLSSVTGESDSVGAGRGDFLHAGAVVRAGEADALVVLTGASTTFGKIVQLVKVAAPKLHMESVVAQVARWLMLAVAALLAVAGGLTAVEGRGLGDLLPLALILLVSAVPVALPAMFTLTLALGSRELSRRGILVTRLSAPEDAARMDVLCSDKTGTLTTNRPSVVDVSAAEGFDADSVLLLGAACSREANQDPIDRAFLEAARSRGLHLEGWERGSFVPFDPRTRRTEATVHNAEGAFRVTKGALESLLELSPDTGPAQRESLRELARRFAEGGQRCVAVARERDGRFVVAGVAALQDRPRPESRALVTELGTLGVRVKMLTGDAPPVAAAVAREVGLGADLVDCGPLHAAGTSPAGRAEEADGFASIYPEDKYAIVKALQERGHIVGMTGDGVNDAPALGQAEVGVAVSNATDAAKGAASVVLTTEGLATLPDLIRVGRSIHQRVETWILNKIIKTFQIVLFVVGTFLATGRLVVSTFNMVLLLFLVDFVTLTLATDRAKGRARPARWEIGALVRSALVLGLAVVAESGLVLWLGWRTLGVAADNGTLQTFGFTIIFYFGLFTVLAVRDRKAFGASKPSAPLLTALVVDMALVALLVTHGAPGVAPLPWRATALVFVASGLLGLVLNDRIKRALMPAEA